MAIQNTGNSNGDTLNVDYVPSRYISTIASGYSTTTAQLASHLNGINNKLQPTVLDFGGYLDGIHDDTDATQALVDYLAATYTRVSILYPPGGKTRIEGQVDLTGSLLTIDFNNCEVRGRNPDRAIFLRSTGTYTSIKNAIFDGDSPTTCKAFFHIYNYVTNVFIDNIFAWGSDIIFQLDHVYSVYFRSCLFGPQWGQFLQKTTGVEITSTITPNTHISFENCEFSLDYGVVATEVQLLTVKNCWFENQSFERCLSLTDCSNVNLTGNIYSGGSATYGGSQIDLNSCSDVVIEKSKFYSPCCADTTAISVDSGCEHIVVDKNIFNGEVSHAFISAASPSIINVTDSNHFIRENRIQSVSVTSGQAGLNYVIGDVIKVAQSGSSSTGYVKVTGVGTSGNVTSVQLLCCGYNYLSGSKDTVLCTSSAGRVNISVNSSGVITGCSKPFQWREGFGYAVGDVLSLSGGNGLGKLRVTTISDGGVLIGEEILVPGSGYTAGACFHTFTRGAGCTVNITVSSGAIQSATISGGASGGSYYRVGDILSVSTGNGDGKVKVTSVSSMVVTQLSVIAAGSGYSSGVKATTRLSGSGCKLDVVLDTSILFSRKGTAAPSTGTWAVGDTYTNTAPSTGQYIGWVCTVAGTPGTWKGFGLIA